MTQASLYADEEGLQLDNQLCFKLYAASRAVIRAYKPMLDQLGLTYPQYLAMLRRPCCTGVSLLEGHKGVVADCCLAVASRR